MNYELRHTSFSGLYWRTEVIRTSARNVSTRRNGPRPETRDETPRPFGPRLRREPRHTGPRLRQDRDVEQLYPRRDRDETLASPKTVSRPRRRDQTRHPCSQRLYTDGSTDRQTDRQRYSVAMGANCAHFVAG